ncbi:hypothetical protein CC86DRAFT_466800 [Ophiobolus disseminans]|uniref:Uncharacterized protein n=1 Tax=Ophiobolus disseminans TaxID=1469910 RepID=A0A6A7A2J0_9PLEO|nr:hypothetical protein CC86DRAFT_466800 [Ophiobolus disseminans]
MEPIAALSLAANILQIVNFTASLVSTSQQIYEAGSSVTVQEVELVVRDFNDLNASLKSWVRPDSKAQGPLTKDNQHLYALVVESEKIARELLSILSPLQRCEQPSKLGSVARAIKTAWNRRKIEEIKQHLGELRQELSRTIVNSVLENKNKLAVALAAQGFDLAQRHKSTEVTSLRRHEQLVRLIQNIGLGNISFDYLDKVKATTNKIRNDLYFGTIDNRFDDIATAHQKTFSWALHNSKDEKSWPSLLDWLREGSGIYWISGKAGSGKSTLMKFLDRHHSLMDALETWISDCPLIVLRFYFWNAGNDLQKTQEELFRSLLHQTLDQAPALGPILFPDRYDQAVRDGAPAPSKVLLGPHNSSTQQAGSPTLHDLKRAFKVLTNRLDGAHKIFMLVDGLDEFETPRMSMTDLAEIFLEASPSHVKALVSSRPLPAFEASFAALPRLRLHLLTYGDITAYVHDKFGAHKRIKELFMEDPAGTRSLTTAIVDGASGVFLWVSLVVKSLIEGLHNYDTLKDLKKRLDEIPRDLEDLFRHMLSKILPEYKEQSSRFFRLLRSSDLAYEMGAKPEYTPLTTIGLYFAEADTSIILEAENDPLPEEDCTAIERNIEGRLRSRCAGLLELKSRAGHQYLQGPGKEVGYLHRTVADFMTFPEVWKDITACSPTYDPYVPLMQSILMCIKVATHHCPSRSHHVDEVWDLVDVMFHYAYLAENAVGSSQQDLLNEFDKTVCQTIKTAPGLQDCINWQNTRPEIRGGLQSWHTSFLALAVSHGLVLYVQSMTAQLRREITSKKGGPLLHYTCTQRRNEHSADMGFPLLQHGANPNQQFGGYSPWEWILDNPIQDSMLWASVAKQFVLHGADPDAIIHSRGVAKSCLLVIKERLQAVKSDTSMPADEKAAVEAEIRSLRREVKSRQPIKNWTKRGLTKVV